MCSKNYCQTSSWKFLWDEINNPITGCVFSNRNTKHVKITVPLNIHLIFVEFLH